MADVPPVANPRLSVQLREIAKRCKQKEVSVEDLVSTLKGRPYLLLIALLSLPFLTPVPLMGASTPIGILFVLFGVRLSFGQTPIVPSSLLKVRLPSRFFPTLLRAASGILRAIETFSRPRLRFLFRKGFLFNIYGICILMMALLLLPPLPIPYSNFLPALTLLLFSLAMIERDGVLLILGALAMLATMAFFAMILWGSGMALNSFWERLFS